MGKLINIFSNGKTPEKSALETFKASLGEKENRDRDNIRVMNKLGLGSKSVEKKISDYIESDRYRPNSSTASKRPAKQKTEAEKDSGLIYGIRADTYKSSNVIYYCKTEKAYSYGWWRFVDRINGVLVFNNYGYSPSTNRHQTKVRNLLDSLGLDYFVIRTDLSLSEKDALPSAIALLIAENHKLTILIEKKGTRKTTNKDRAEKIEKNRREIKLIQKLNSYKSQKAKTLKNTERY